MGIGGGDPGLAGRATVNDAARDGEILGDPPLSGQKLQRRKTTISRDDMELEIFSRHNDQALYTPGRLDFRGEGLDAPSTDLAAATRG
jgi:hypothetical protein